MRLGAIRAVVVIAVLMPAVPVVAGPLPTDNPPKGCTADPLVDCRSRRAVDREAQKLTLDLKVTSPAMGTLPGSGVAQRRATLRGRRNLDEPVSGLSIRMDLRVSTAFAAFSRPVGDEEFGPGPDTAARVVASLEVRARRCRSRCTDTDARTIVSIGCGSRSGIVSLFAFISPGEGKRIRPGPIDYTLTLDGLAALGTFPFDPPRPDSGSVAAGATVRIERVEVRKPDPNALPGFIPGQQCFNVGSSNRGSITTASGADVVFGAGYLKIRHRGWTRFAIAAQGTGVAVGASGTFVPGWYELIVGGFGFLIARGELGPGDHSVSADGKTTTVRVTFPVYGRGVLRFTEASEPTPTMGAGTSTGYGSGGTFSTWSAEVDMLHASHARISGRVGRHKVRATTPWDDRFAFRGAAGKFETCTNCII
jgi:hypothetical protein